MFDLDRWYEIYTLLNKHKLRTFLTAFGVFWGIFMLILLLGAGMSLKHGAMSNFVGDTNSVYIWSGRPTQHAYKGFSKGRRVGLNIDDRDYLRQHLPEAEIIIEGNSLGGWRNAQYITRGKRSGSYETRGTHGELAIMNNYQILHGRFLNKLDYKDRRKVIVLGVSAYEELFSQDENPVGSSVKVGGLHFTVVGVFKARNAGDTADREAQRAFIPNSTLRHAFNQTGWIGSFSIRPKQGFSGELIEKKAVRLLQEKHHVHPDDTAVFGSYNLEKDFIKVSSLFEGIRLFSWFVAVGTLLAGVIGVGNIMLIVVKERTREIGLRKALGATKSSILGLIIQESIAMTAVAGYIGLVAGIGVLELLRIFVERVQPKGFGVPTIDFSTALLALGILIFAGLLASILPARKAAAVNPIIALQDE